MCVRVTHATYLEASREPKIEIAKEVIYIILRPPRTARAGAGPKQDLRRQKGEAGRKKPGITAASASSGESERDLR